MNGPTPSELELQIQQRLLEELTHAERRYRTLLERLQDVVIESDLDGRISYLNPVWQRVLGYPVSQCLDRPLVDFIHPDSPIRDLQALVEGDHNDLCLRHRDGRPVWFEISLTRSKDTLVGLLYNVDRHKETERTLKQARDAALEAARLRSEFLANMSHEIRTPLHGLMGMLELLAQGELAPEQRDFAETAYRSARHLMTLLSDILDLSRIEAGGLRLETAPVDLHQLLDDAVALMRAPAGEKGLELVLWRAPDLPRWIESDAARLRQILFNLLSNAVKFTERGRVALRAEVQGGWLCLAVEDSGIGIRPEDQERIFQAFVQGDGSSTRRHGGTGLGLAICRRLAEAMDGRLELHSTPGEGSTFTLTLPLKRADIPYGDGSDSGAGTDPGRAPPPREGEGEKKRLLVVEDNAVNRKLAMHMLARLGYAVDLAADGEEGVEKAMERRYDAIVMDCQMPIMDGFEATRRIRASQGPNLETPIIALTANTLPEDREACLAVMDDYLGKPLRLNELAQCLRRWTEREVPEGKA